MPARVKTSVLMGIWAVLVIAPWVNFTAHSWEIEADCDQVARAPEGFGYWTASAALVSLPFALGAVVQERRWMRALCLLACLVSLSAIVGGVLVSMVIQGSSVDCGGPPWPEST